MRILPPNVQKVALLNYLDHPRHFTLNCNWFHKGLPRKKTSRGISLIDTGQSIIGKFKDPKCLSIHKEKQTLLIIRHTLPSQHCPLLILIQNYDWKWVCLVNFCASSSNCTLWSTVCGLTAKKYKHQVQQTHLRKKKSNKGTSCACFGCTRPS